MLNHSNDFFSWFKDFLDKRGLKFSKCGFKGGSSLGTRHEIDRSTGDWRDVNYSKSKPPRWLFRIEPRNNRWLACDPPSERQSIGAINSAQEDKAAAVFRLLPQLSHQGRFVSDPDLEVNVLFAFHGATPKGSSSQSFYFTPATGELNFKGKPLGYIVAGLLGLKNRAHAVPITSPGVSLDVTYGEVVDSLSRIIKVKPELGNAGRIQIFDLTQRVELDRLKTMIEDAWRRPGPLKAIDQKGPPGNQGDDNEDEEIVVPASLKVREHSDLLGIDPAVYRQINAALASGKQHIMLYGPPGTGKTSLARHVATTITGGKWTMVTGSADWSSQDIIGGYQPVGGGKVAFIPGVLLRRFDRPLILDELNRCDIDKVIGPLFTVLSGQETTLPYRLDSEDEHSRQYVILPEPKVRTKKHEFAPGPNWRLIATINSIDKAALYQMSYALTRRFCWIYVDAPKDTTAFVVEFLQRQDPTWDGPAAGVPCPLGALWSAINAVRTVGPAPIIDAIKAISAMIDEPDFFTEPDRSMMDALLDALDMVLLPMLDGISIQDAEKLAEEASKVMAFDQAHTLRIRERLLAVSF